MPWTLSHPAAVLPLRRFCKRPLTFAALVTGSMTPDIGYYINRFDLSDFAHTFIGSFAACLPTGVILLLGLCLFCRPICYSLPSPHRQALLPLCPGFPRGLGHWGILLLALLLGTWTHTFWDSFTHEHGWFVDRWSWLQQPLGYWWFTTVYVYFGLQELSTVVGFVIIVIAYRSWLHRRLLTLSPSAENETWRHIFWFGAIAIPFAIAVPMAVWFAMGTKLRGLLFARSISVRTAIYLTQLVPPIILIGSSVTYLRRPR